MDESNEVDCFRAILSEQDLERVGGASGREGFRRTQPSAEKYPRPWSMVGSVDGKLSEEVAVEGGRSQGVESS